MSSENLLYYGDNLDILRRYVTFKKAAKAKGKKPETLHLKFEK